MSILAMVDARIKRQLAKRKAEEKVEPVVDLGLSLDDPYEEPHFRHPGQYDLYQAHPKIGDPHD